MGEKGRDRKMEREVVDSLQLDEILMTFFRVEYSQKYLRQGISCLYQMALHLHWTAKPLFLDGTLKNSDQQVGKTNPPALMHACSYRIRRQLKTCST